MNSLSVLIAVSEILKYLTDYVINFVSCVKEHISIQLLLINNSGYLSTQILEESY